MKNGKITGLSFNVGSYLEEAARVCLFLNGHKSGVELKVLGDFVLSFKLIWKDSVEEKILKNWQDEKEAVEYYATAIAILLIEELTEFTFWERVAQTDVADYLLNKKNNSSTFEDENPFAYLEVSGIWRETTNNTLNMRFNLKQKRAKKENLEGFPYYVITAEFGTPKSKIGKNE